MSQYKQLLFHTSISFIMEKWQVIRWKLCIFFFFVQSADFSQWMFFSALMSQLMCQNPISQHSSADLFPHLDGLTKHISSSSVFCVYNNNNNKKSNLIIVLIEVDCFDLFYFWQTPLLPCKWKQCHTSNVMPPNLLACKHKRKCCSIN